MFRFIKQVFIILLGFCRSLATKFVYLKIQSSLAKLILIDISPNKPLYYPSLVSVDKCVVMCLFLLIITAINCYYYVKLW